MHVGRARDRADIQHSDEHQQKHVHSSGVATFVCFVLVFLVRCTSVRVCVFIYLYVLKVVRPESDRRKRLRWPL